MIPMTDLREQYRNIKEEIDGAVLKVLDEGNYILGDEVRALEEEIASYCGAKYAVGVASGTDALVLSVISCGIKEGDEVITTPFTFIATIEAIVRSGAKPVFADVDRKTYNIDVSEIQKKITEKTKAIIPVHLYGNPCDMTPIMRLAKEHKLNVIEDCAQSFGAELNGKKTGSFGDFGCFSFFPAKNLGCCGDGGMLVTNDENYAKKVRLLRSHGFSGDYEYRLHGFNSRLDTVQAAVVKVKMKYIDGWVKSRIENAATYGKELSDVSEVETPFAAPGAKHSMNYYTLRITSGLSTRDALRKYLVENGISSNVYYPMSLHLAEICRGMGYRKGDFPVAERLQEEVLSLPMYPELKKEQIKHICGRIKTFFNVVGNTPPAGGGCSTLQSPTLQGGEAKRTPLSPFEKGG